jgi:hypothetical protein
MVDFLHDRFTVLLLILDRMQEISAKTCDLRCASSIHE